MDVKTVELEVKKEGMLEKKKEKLYPLHSLKGKNEGISLICT